MVKSAAIRMESALRLRDRERKEGAAERRRQLMGADGAAPEELCRELGLQPAHLRPKAGLRRRACACAHVRPYSPTLLGSFTHTVRNQCETQAVGAARTAGTARTAVDRRRLVGGAVDDPRLQPSCLQRVPARPIATAREIQTPLSRALSVSMCSLREHAREAGMARTRRPTPRHSPRPGPPPKARASRRISRAGHRLPPARSGRGRD